MTIEAMENNTIVVCPGGYTGRLSVTRRVRSMIDADDSTEVEVRGSDGLCRRYRYNELVKRNKRKVNPDVVVSQWWNRVCRWDCWVGSIINLRWDELSDSTKETVRDLYASGDYN